MSISVSEATYIQNDHGRLHCLLAMVFCLLSFSAISQQQWQFSQYQFNLYDFNAAYAGAYNETSLGMRYRQMWSGFDGAPRSLHFSAHTPFDQSLSGGVKVLSEEIGAHERLIIKASGAYAFKTSRGRLAFALGGGVVQSTFLNEKLILRQNNDPFNYGTASSSHVAFDASVLYTQNNLYAGLQVDNTNAGGSNNLAKHYTGAAGYVFKIGEEHALRPSVLGRYTEGAPFQGEAHVAFMWKNLLWLGAGYRFDYGFVATTELKITPNLRLGYSLDLATNDLQTFQNGSHELFLGFNFKLKSQKTPSIRFF
jgi:type IX secretion system PorP/SprF family membrane protein